MGAVSNKGGLKILAIEERAVLKKSRLGQSTFTYVHEQRDR